MKALFTILALGLAVNAGADTFMLKDGAKLEGDVTGEMDGALLVKTKYGSLTINKADIQSQQTAQAAAAVPADPAVSQSVPVQASTAATVAVTSAAPAAISPAQPAAEAPGPVRLTFTTIQPSTSTRLLVYSANWVVIATETFDAGGNLLSTDGAIRDGTYLEYYDGGALRTVKTISGGKVSGSLKTYYRSGKLQIEAYYLGGEKEGAFSYYSESGKPLMEAAYSKDRLNGWKKEFTADGAVQSQAYYIDDHVAEPPKARTAPEPEKEPESMVAVKTLDLTRGELFTFQLNGKYIGKVRLDKEFNLINLEGKMPDGAVKVYSKDGKLQKEFVFEKAGIKLLRVYGDGDQPEAEYTFKDDKAVKK